MVEGVYSTNAAWYNGVNSNVELQMHPLRGTWDKIPPGPGKPSEQVDIVILGFGQVSNSNTAETRPVAIVQDLSDDNRLRYAELKYVKIKGE